MASVYLSFLSDKQPEIHCSGRSHRWNLLALQASPAETVTIVPIFAYSIFRNTQAF
jgi:hypothetical protein